ncbi:MAG: hypothetical protein E7487_11600 [Ruminococcaceae bacterium]|nr:hypothetical protein [Oscillospiraceae bacterium]
MKKVILALLLSVTIVLGMCIPASAAENAASIIFDLNFIGSAAECEASISAVGYEINATLELWSGSTFIASWSESGVDDVYIYGLAPVSKGNPYTLKVTGTIGDETISVQPIHRTFL